MASNRGFPLNMGDAARMLGSDSRERVEKQYEESRRIVEWSKQPVTQKILKELQDKEKEFTKKMNRGGCKDHTEYLACVYAINKVKGLGDIIQKHINVCGRVESARLKKKGKEGK